MFRNLFYIKTNHRRVLKRLRAKFGNEKIKIVFYVYDETKWKCQSLYDLLVNDERFEVQILVSRTAVFDTKNSSWQSIEDVKKTYDFFKQKGMNVVLAYDIVQEKFIPFLNFKPDIIIYQHPWYVETSQGPVVCSKFALTAYVPYYFPTTASEIDYYLRFHQYVENYYVFDETSRKYYADRMQNRGKNLKVTGQPFLDYFRFNPSQEKKYTIYAPHWTLCGKGIAYGTFEWNGKFMLDYAKQHPEMNWIFKPHPLLKKALVDNGIMTGEEVEKYYNTWERFEHGDYLELFSQSQMLITDCSSFLGEYFMSGNPVIHLISDKAKPYNKTVKQIVENYYPARNLEELQRLLEELPQNDWMKEQREKALEKLNYKDNYAAKNILDDILTQLEAK